MSTEYQGLFEGWEIAIAKKLVGTLPDFLERPPQKKHGGFGPHVEPKPVSRDHPQRDSDCELTLGTELQLP